MVLPGPCQAGVCALGGGAAAWGTPGGLQVLTTFSAKMKTEVVMERFLKFCTRGRIGSIHTDS